MFFLLIGSNRPRGSRSKVHSFKKVVVAECSPSPSAGSTPPLLFEKIAA